jgi:hypothetical protein
MIMPDELIPVEESNVGLSRALVTETLNQARGWIETPMKADFIQSYERMLEAAEKREERWGRGNSDEEVTR